MAEWQNCIGLPPPFAQSKKWNDVTTSSARCRPVRDSRLILNLPGTAVPGFPGRRCAAAAKQMTESRCCEDHLLKLLSNVVGEFLFII
jgi:hypothetical protein